MKSVFECVPNFSEGRRPEVITAIVDAARVVEGIRVLDLHSDADHNRSVLTLAGERDPLVEGVYRSIAKATELIDLREHTGEHPRMGATDVVPFIPLGDAGMGEAIEMARELGDRVARDLHIPVYFYEEAAATEERRNLEKIRGKGFEHLRDTIGEAGRTPDLGPPEIHPSAGAVVIGARGPLIAYNIYLATTDLTVAKAIAKAVRHSSGGLRYVKALGIDIPALGQVQVSMNLTNFRKTAVHTVFNLVRSEADAFGVAITHTEVVGLIPMAALVEAAQHYLRLHHLETDQILETRLFGE